MKEIGLVFIWMGLIALLTGMFFGCFAAFQFVVPEMNQFFSFQKTRPLHVSLVISWLFLCSVGGIYYYLPKKCGLPLFSPKLASLHLWIFLITGIIVVTCYFLGVFGGREYWEFPPVLAAPIVISWILFGINYLKTIATVRGQWPVYYWMWGTGIVFFLLSFLQSYLWLLPYFRNSIVRDLTVQWKSYGEIVGCWNMLIYGTAIFLMEKISEHSNSIPTRVSGQNSKFPSNAPVIRIAYTRLAFLLFALGLVNLMFGWAHHLYMVPSAGWIRHMGYVISMTELLVLGKIIWGWRKSFLQSKNNFGILAFRFLIASDFWILVNLTLAILISIPAINVYTHSTHITVAHAMGSTIGINSMILLASVFYVVSLKLEERGEQNNLIQNFTNPGLVNKGFWITNISLLVFLICLVVAGIVRGHATIAEHKSFQEISVAISPFIRIFAYSGLVLFIGFCMIIFPALRFLIRSAKAPVA